MSESCTAVRIACGSHVTLHYRLAVLVDGAEREVVSTFGERPATLTVGEGAIAAALENCLVGLAEGARERFELPPQDGFGLRNGELVQTLTAGAFRAGTVAQRDYAPGDVVEFRSPDGLAVSGVLKSRDGERVVVDFNHPLAGLPVRFDVQVVGVL